MMSFRKMIAVPVFLAFVATTSTLLGSSSGVEATSKLELRRGSARSSLLDAVDASESLGESGLSTKAQAGSAKTSSFLNRSASSVGKAAESTRKAAVSAGKATGNAVVKGSKILATPVTAPTKYVYNKSGRTGKNVMWVIFGGLMAVGLLIGGLVATSYFGGDAFGAIENSDLNQYNYGATDTTPAEQIAGAFA